MNETEIGRIAAAMNQLRPDWPVASLKTLLEKPELSSRPRRDIAVALAWVACESATKTPARVLEAGPWWQGDPTSGSSPRQPYDENKTCAVCSLVKDQCRSRWTGDHEYVSIARHRSNRSSGPWPEMPPPEWTEAEARQYEASRNPHAEEARQAIRAAREAKQAADTRQRPEFVEPPQPKETNA